MGALSSTVIKQYPRRGPMRQFRLSASTSFACIRCGEAKVSRLVVTYEDDWQRLLCNGCYGRLLSIYDVKAGTAADDVKADELGKILLKCASEDQTRETLRRMMISERRLQFLSPQALKFVSTSQFVAESLGSADSLDWSPAVIGLCKAFEFELTRAVVAPLQEACRGLDLREDVADKDLGRVAKFCAGQTVAPPELGSVAHFFMTAIGSRERAQSSPILKLLRQLLTTWPRSSWISERRGLVDSVRHLTSAFRNRAAHTDELTAEDYAACSEFVVGGSSGILWHLISATRDTKDLRSDNRLEPER